MPQALRAKQAMIRTMAFVGILGGLALFFFAPWWAAVGVLFIALYMFPHAQKMHQKGFFRLPCKAHKYMSLP